eukprot:1159735-Pelagomonas_calceolata.AAC.1
MIEGTHILSCISISGSRSLRWAEASMCYVFLNSIKENSTVSADTGTMSPTTSDQEKEEAKKECASLSYERRRNYTQAGRALPAQFKG